MISWLIPAVLSAEEAPVSDPITLTFSAHDASSPIRVDHGTWSQFLSKTVVYAGYSTERLGRGKKRRWIDSKFEYGNDQPSRYENNRVAIGNFTKDHHAAVRVYRRFLQGVPETVPLSALTREEQLAYWLNLYNARVMELVTAHYPAETTKELRSEPGKDPAGVWHEKSLTVDGVALSLRDIETKILFPIWDDPLVMYGLWQGAIGGPSLPLRAYSAASVWDRLRENAVEFINSNRGMRPKGRTLRVSLMYGWASDLFDGDDDIRRHIENYAELPFSEGLEKTSKLKRNLYDWHLADLSGGAHHRGQWNNNAAFIAGLNGDPQFVNALANIALSTDTTRRTISPLTQELLVKMREFNDQTRTPVITVEDCPADGCIKPDLRDDDDNATVEENDRPN